MCTPTETAESTGNIAFITAAEDARKFKFAPSDNQLLQLYAFYKQAIFGDNNTVKPGLLDIKGKAKWNAWDALKGTSKAKAQQEYIELVQGLKQFKPSL